MVVFWAKLQQNLFLLMFGPYGNFSQIYPEAELIRPRKIYCIDLSEK